MLLRALSSRIRRRSLRRAAVCCRPIINQVAIKSSEGAYTVDSFMENLIIFFENPHSNFQSCIVVFEGCVVVFELRDDTILNIDSSVQSCVVIFELCDDTILNIDFSVQSCDVAILNIDFSI
jgi:hypothetical protein